MMSIRAPLVKAQAGQRRAVLAQAAPDRRVVLSALVAGVSSLAAGKAVADVTSVDLFDDRGAKKKGFDIIYEARDLDLPQNERDGISQYRGDLTATKARYSEAERRINTKLGDYVKTQYWSDAKEELRLQVGNFRQDLRTLATSKGSKSERKAALAAAKDVIVAAESLDYAIRSKDPKEADKLYAALKTKLSAFTSAVVA